ncbi:uncharacterized protein ACR2FA_008393 [Aphomia sociella]
MNQDDISSVDYKEWNFCRCCRKTGCFKDITAEYDYSDQKEIYEDMLKNTFDIQVNPALAHHQQTIYFLSFNTQISQQKTNGMNPQCRQICEDCILRLRDASSFKHMVLESEKLFLECIQSSHCLESKSAVNALKLELIKVENLAVTSDDYVKSDDDTAFDDDEILANIKLELNRSNDLSHSLAPLKPKRSRKLTAPKTSNSKDSEKQKDWTKIAERRGNGPILREISLKLLANSTMCVFQWNKSRYRCFCCKEPFSDMSTLRNHTAEHHTLENIEKKIILQQNRLVKVEISHLHCRLCDKQLENLEVLRQHLSTDHNMTFTLKEDLLVPFKIQNGNLHCQICLESFNKFRLLNIHMNKHYQKQVCHICGAGFSNLVFLNLHKTRSHRPLSCKHCDLIFTTRIEKKSHDADVHGVIFERKLRFPCPYCKERFYQENFRVQHLVECHGMAKPEYRCNVCSKVFITRSLCNNHLKNVHMKEKNHECNVCHNFFYTKSDVLRHKVTHTGEKKFSCEVCNGPFATKDSLRRHMKRTHGGLN